MVIISGKDLGAWRHRQLAALPHQVGRARSHHSVETLAFELDWLLQELTELDRLALKLDNLDAQSAVQSTRSLAEIEHLWRQRIEACVPVQYLVGQVTWRHFQLRVTPAVLIPRPETELIVDIVLDVAQNPTSLALSNLKQSVWADLGTGSGAIALGLADAFPESYGYAVDISPEALEIARENAHRYHLADRITFLQGSWFEPLANLRGQLSLIVSNPPYIPTPIIGDLQPEVVRHEPHLALDGGEDGLNAIRQLVQTAHCYLQPGGLLILECMAGQGEAIQSLLEAAGRYCDITIHRDWAKFDRFVLAYARA